MSELTNHIEEAFGKTCPREEVNPNLITNPWKLFSICVGLVLSIGVSAMDETIIATSMDAITGEFNASDQATWVASSYLLTMTASTPLYGKFSDIFGRKICLLFSLFVFLFGSIICGVANSVIIVIVFRAVSGIGAGGLIALPLIVISGKKIEYLTLFY